MSNLNALQMQAELVSEQCCECGITFAVPKQWLRTKKENHKSIYCPNGHGFHYPSESDTEKLERRLRFEKNRRQAAERESRHNANVARAQKAAKTRLKNRIKNGVCPCCNRTFANLASHIDNKHPEYKK